MRIRLQIDVPQGSPFTFEHTGPTVHIGRNPACELVLTADIVSWDHARIDLRSGAATIADLGSSNGTYCNGKPVETATDLKVGDVVRFGQTGPEAKVVALAPGTPPPRGRPVTPAPPSRRRDDVPVALPYCPQSDAFVKQPTRVSPARPSRAHAGEERQTQAPKSNQTMLIVLAGVCLSALLFAGVVWRQSRESQSDSNSSTSAPKEARGLSTGTSELQTSDTNAKVQAPPNDANNKPGWKPNPAKTAIKPDEQSLGQYVVAPKAPPSVLLERPVNLDIWGRRKPESRVQPDVYLVSLPGYRNKIYLDSGVHLTLWGNVPAFSVFPPVLECTVMLQTPSPNFDAEFVLDHGRVHVANYKAQGPAQVRIRFLHETWDLTLHNPETEAVAELWGMYSPETPLSLEPGGNGPEIRLDLFSKGKATLKVHSQEHAISGMSHVSWSKGGAGLTGPRMLPRLPDWWTDRIAAAKPEVADTMAALADYDKLLNQKPAVLDAVFTEVRESDDACVRALGTLILGAIDALPQLVDALEDRVHVEVRSAARIALQAWISRSVEHRLELYHTLFERKGYAKDKAQIVMELLHGISASAAQQPETYQKLIDYLNHENLVIRDMAWHRLVYLAPREAKGIDYEPNADPEKRKLAVAEWKKRLPAGKLPLAPG